MNILVVGGTGTLGRALIKHYSAEGDKHSITCFSRDELKQQEMKREFPKVRYVLGDIRDGIDLDDGYSALFHVAALKHIDVLESNVQEAVRTNVLGTFNVAAYAQEKKIPVVAFSSTDKAVAPINVYGHTKAISERYLNHLNRAQPYTRFLTFRWGNVLGSRGSVAHAFAKTLKEERKIYLTHEDMTRFWIRIEDAVRFMASAVDGGLSKFYPRFRFHTPDGTEPDNGVFIPPDMKASTVISLALAVAERVNVGNFDIEYTGLRPGEKIHESLTEDLNSEMADQYSVDELVELLEGVL